MIAQALYCFKLIFIQKQIMLSLLEIERDISQGNVTQVVLLSTHQTTVSTLIPHSTKLDIVS